MPKLMFILMAGARATRTFRKQILEFAGFRPVLTTIYGAAEWVSDETRRKRIEKTRAMGRRAA
jgi:hypothetical protein